MSTMRPDLRKLSITSFQTQVLGSDSSLAVVEHDGVNGGRGHGSNARHLHSVYEASSNKTQHVKSTPRELIHHETLSSLIEEMRELRVRCDSLEEANAELRSDVQAVKQATIVTQMVQEPIPSRIDLTGYESSESSGSSETAVFGKSSVVGKQDFNSFKGFIESKVDAMTTILERFNGELTAEGVARYRLGQDLDRVRQDATKTKGHLGGIKAEMKEVRSDLAKLDTCGAGQQNSFDRASRRDRYDEDKVFGVEQQLAAALDEIQDLTHEVKQQASIIKSLQGQLDAGAIQTLSDGAIAAGAAGSITDVNAAIDSREFAFVQQTLHGMIRKATMQQQVDDLASKDLLHIAHAHLDRCLNDAEASSDDILTADCYLGTYDDLWSLRDRVLRRLITIDSYGKALEEARRAQVYL